MESLNLSQTNMGTLAVTEIMRVLRAPWSASADDKECNVTLQVLDISHNHLLKVCGKVCRKTWGNETWNRALGAVMGLQSAMEKGSGVARSVHCFPS